MDERDLAANVDRRVRRLALAARDLAAGATAILSLRGRMTDGLRATPPANLVRASAEAIGHANVSAAADLGMIVPGP